MVVRSRVWGAGFTVLRAKPVMSMKLEIGSEMNSIAKGESNFQFLLTI